MENKKNQLNNKAPFVKKIEVLFVLDSLEGGGTQRVLLNILHHIDKQIFDPALTIVKRKGEYENMLPGDVCIYDLKATRARYAFIQLAQLINEIKPAVLFSSTPYIDGCIYLSLNFVRYTPKILVRSPNFLSKKLKKLPLYTYLLTRLFYKKANMIIASTKAMSWDLQKNFNIFAKKIRIIPNPVNLEIIASLASEKIDHPWFDHKSKKYLPIVIAMGRLVEQKGFKYLIRAFSIVLKDIRARLVILGKGNQLNELQALAKELKVEEYVNFLGFQHNPYKYIAAANVFVMSSLWEGFPNALIEAMVCETPVVSTNCLSGPNEIIEHGKSGLLVPVENPEALAKAILKIHVDKSSAKKLAKGGRKRSTNFMLAKVVSKYEQTFKEVYNM